MRPVRNSGVRIAPLEEVERYLLQHRAARHALRQTGRPPTLRIPGAELSGLPVVPMSVVVRLPWRWGLGTGSETALSPCVAAAFPLAIGSVGGHGPGRSRASGSRWRSSCFRASLRILSCPV
jgi:hypothetical protein